MVRSMFYALQSKILCSKILRIRLNALLPDKAGTLVVMRLPCLYYFRLLNNETKLLHVSFLRYTVFVLISAHAPISVHPGSFRKTRA